LLLRESSLSPTAKENKGSDLLLDSSKHSAELMDSFLSHPHDSVDDSFLSSLRSDSATSPKFGFLDSSHCDVDSLALFHPSPNMLNDIDEEDDIDPAAEDDDDCSSSHEMRICSLDSVLAIVNQLHEHKLTPNDLDAFEALRNWGSSDDMQQAVSSLSYQRDLLLNKLVVILSSFAYSNSSLVVSSPF
jgi:hypothetical protein